MPTKLVALFLLLMLTATASAQQSINGSVIRDATLPAGKLAPFVSAGGSAARTLVDRAADEANIRDFGAVCDGVVDDRGALSSAYAAGAPVVGSRCGSGLIRLASNLTFGPANVSVQLDPKYDFTGAGLLKFDELIPWQSRPVFARRLLSRSYTADSWADSYQNVFEDAVYVRSTATTAAVVAQFGEGDAAGSGARTWGGNFVGVATGSGGTAIAAELNPVTLDPGGITYGLVIASAGTAPPQNFIQMQANNDSTIPVDAIVFNASNRKTASGALIHARGAYQAPERGVQLEGAYTVAEIDVPSFAVSATPSGINSKVTVVGSAAGNPSIRARPAGASPAAAAGLSIESLGGANVNFATDTGGPTQVRIKHAASAVNRIELSGAPTTGTPTVAAEGSDSNVSLNLTPKGSGSVRINGGIGGTAVKHGRIATGSISSMTSALVTLTWAAAFADASYSATCSVADSTAAAAALRVVHLESVTAAAVAVRVENTSLGALSGTLHCIAMHD